MSGFSIKIKTSIMVVFAVVVLFTTGTIMYFQYKSSNEFAMITTQKVFDRVSDRVINQIEAYDISSKKFIDLSKNINGITEDVKIDKRHTLFPIITQYIKNADYVYGIYLGYGDDSFYIIYNLDLSLKMKTAQNAPKGAKWLVKKHIKNKNGDIVSYKEFLDKDLTLIEMIREVTDYRPTQRPWYKDAVTSDKMIKTKPYIFSAIGEPGITYSQLIDVKKGVILSLDITLSSLSSLLEQQNLAKGSAAFIFKNDGKVIGQVDNISNKKAKNIQKAYPNLFIKDGSVVDLEVQKVITVNGIKYLKYTTLLRSNFNTKDYLTILSPIDPIMKPYKDKIFETLGITALILLFVILPIIFYAVRLIVRPILELQEQNKKIENGDFEEVNSVDSFMLEISNLSQSLVTMSSAIEEKTNSIKSLNENLEQKVKDRTRNLEDTKKEVELVLSSILSPVLITNKETRKIMYANKYAEVQYDTTLDKMIGSSIEDLYTAQGQSEELVRQMKEKGFIEHLEQDFKTNSGKKFTALLSVIPITYHNVDAYIGITADITKQKETERTVKNLLNNAGQGFLYFNKDMIIGQEYSTEAKKIFKKEIAGENITELLIEDEGDRMFFDATLKGILGEDEMRQEVLISLLQNEFEINKRFIEVEYKVLNEESFMMILTDVTAKKRLAEKVKREQQVLKMVVMTVTTLEQFLDVKSDYEEFISRLEELKDLDKLSALRKEIHTYKGLFAQKEMLNIVQSLHDFESLIDKSIKKGEVDTIILETTRDDMSSWLQKDIEVLKGILGDDILSRSNEISIDRRRIEDIIIKIDRSTNPEEIGGIRKDIEKLTYHNVETYLKPYEKLVEQLAKRLEKYINPLELKCDEIFIPDQYRAFLNSIVHIFRNSVDHGIETLDERYEKEKPEYGTIKCIARQENNNLLISISDDGAGVDTEKIRSIAVKKGIYTEDEVQTLSEDDVVMIIFEDAFSTSEKVTDVSGRGVGLASILSELDKLGGTMQVNNNFGHGIEFNFNIPLGE